MEKDKTNEVGEEEKNSLLLSPLKRMTASTQTPHDKKIKVDSTKDKASLSNPPRNRKITSKQNHLRSPSPTPKTPQTPLPHRLKMRIHHLLLQKKIPLHLLPHQRNSLPSYHLKLTQHHHLYKNPPSPKLAKSSLDCESNNHHS